MRVRISLESKICILVGVLLFALLFAVGYTQLNSYHANLMSQKMEEYRGLSTMLALTCTSSSDTVDLSRYHEYTTRFMHTDPDVSYVVIADSTGTVLYANSRTLTARQHRSLVGERVRKILSLVGGLGRQGDEDVVSFEVPATVRPGEHGTITVGFVAGSVNAIMEEAQASLLCTFALALLVGIVGALLIAKAITSPLTKLMAAARAVSAGDLDVRVRNESPDEIGEFVDTFNRMVVSLRDSRDKLIERANTDSLTGLHNHRYFQERLRSELRRAQRYDRPLSVIMLDIDDFKVLNDTYGHPVGDSILQDLAKILLAAGRSDIDVVCRYGGEEFAIILPETDSEDARIVAERIRENVQNNFFTGEDGAEIGATVSLGVAQYPVHSSECEGLIMAADLALYQSKSIGKNRTTVFSNDTREDPNRDPYRLYLLLNATDLSTLEAIAVAVDTKGHRSPEYSAVIAGRAVAVAKELGLSETEQRDVRIASLLRDIGKLGISSAILTKEGDLSDEERSIIESHVTLGYSVVQKSTHLKSMLPGILYHHERWDGTGYPKGLKGESIPLIARIIAVLDAYHAMTTKRPHCRPKSVDEAVVELRQGAGTQFDPHIVEVFIHVLERESAEDQAA